MNPPDFQLEAPPASVPMPGAELTSLPPSPLTILEAAVRGGVTQENVAVVKELLAMAREQRADEAKAAFAKAFFQLRKNMPEIYADKQGKDLAGNPTFSYCSEEEISRMIEPHLMAHGFAMLFGQSESDGRITVNITLMHEQGHSETREFTVRSGTPNRMKDAAMCDSGGATTAWRHLVMKMFGLKSRISREDARTIGEPITFEQAETLREMVKEVGANEAKFLAFAGAARIEEIGTADYGRCFAALQKKRGG